MFKRIIKFHHKINNKLNSLSDKWNLIGVDLSKFNDEKVYDVKWDKVDECAGGGNFTSYKLVFDSEDNCYFYKATVGLKLWLGVFFFAPIIFAMIFVYQGRSDELDLMFYSFALSFMVVPFFIAGGIFDRNCFDLDKKIIFLGRRRKCIKILFSEIYTFQLIEVSVGGGQSGVYSNYQLNIVLNDLTRKGICLYPSYKKAKADTEIFSQVLDKKLWDAVALKYGNK